MMPSLAPLWLSHPCQRGFNRRTMTGNCGALAVRIRISPFRDEADGAVGAY